MMTEKALLMAEMHGMGEIKLSQRTGEYPRRGPVGIRRRRQEEAAQNMEKKP